MLGLGLSLQKGVSAFNAGRALVSSYIRRVTDAGGVLQNTACDAAAINELNQDRLLEPASWVLVPDGIKEDVVFAQKPTDGLGDLTFTRASDATRTNSAGVIERTPWNLFTYSEMFSNSSWTKNGGTIVVDAAVAPNGTLTADKLIPNNGQSPTGGTYELLSQVGTLRAAVYTFSIYAKAAEFTSIRFRETIFSGQLLTVDLTNGAITGGGSQFISPSAVSVGNGWYRISFTSNSTTLMTVSQQYTIRCAETGNGTSGIFIWGAQLVEGTDAKPYFATTNRQDVPRLDYRNADGSLSTCPRLLLEPQRTNLVPAGLTFFTATGVNYDSTITASPAPGIQNATRITKNEAAGTIRYANQAVSATLLSGSSTYSLSRYFKYDGFDFQTTMEFNNSSHWGGVPWSVPINISSTSITIGTPTACTATIVNMGSGWYRVTATITTGAIPVGFPTYLMRLPSTLSTGQGFLTALPQLELGAYATTFIPTTTAAVTRLADSASKTGVSSLIGQSSGTLFAEFNFGGIVDGRDILNVNSGTTANFTSIFILGGLLYVRMRANAGALINVTKSAFTAGTHKVAVAYANNDLTMYLDGVLVGQNTSASVAFSAPLSVIRLAETVGGGSSSQLGGGVAQAALFPARLTDAQLVSLTSL